jgi:hypothetical protein
MKTRKIKVTLEERGDPSDVPFHYEEFNVLVEGDETPRELATRIRQTIEQTHEVEQPSPLMTMRMGEDGTLIFQDALGHFSVSSGVVTMPTSFFYEHAAAKGWQVIKVNGDGTLTANRALRLGEGWVTDPGLGGAKRELTPEGEPTDGWH